MRVTVIVTKVQSSWLAKFEALNCTWFGVGDGPGDGPGVGDGDGDGVGVGVGVAPTTDWHGENSDVPFQSASDPGSVRLAVAVIS